MKFKSTKKQKRRARLILERITQAEGYLQRGEMDEAAYVTKFVREDTRELLLDIELANLERWAKL